MPESNRRGVEEAFVGEGFEVQVPQGSLYVGCISLRGVSPKCCGLLAQSSTREECHNYIKKISFLNPRGWVWIAIFMAHKVFELKSR